MKHSENRQLIYKQEKSGGDLGDRPGCVICDRLTDPSLEKHSSMPWSGFKINLGHSAKNASEFSMELPLFSNTGGRQSFG